MNNYKSAFPYLVDVSVGDSCPFNCPMCVVPDTEITTPAGNRKISELNIGDAVYSYNENSDRRMSDIIDEIFVREIDEEIYEITLEDGQKLLITKEHPTFVNNKYIPASELKVGDELLKF